MIIKTTRVGNVELGGIMVKPRFGRQTPTQSVVIPYSKTHGQEAIDLYNRTGRTAFPWQELLAYDILAENDEGMWIHTKLGLAVSRRSYRQPVK